MKDEESWEGGLVIPPLLHQMWIAAPGRGGPSRRNLHFVKQTKDRFRGFRYTFWSNVEPLFDRFEELAKYRHLYHSVTPHICKCDIARYMVLYAHGGFYADLDVNLEREVPSWMMKRELLFFLENDRVNMPKVIVDGVDLVPYHVTNSLMASIPQHPFWLHLLDSIEEQFRHGTPDNPPEVMHYTGPRRLALQLMEELKGEDDAINSHYRPLPPYYMDRKKRHPERLATLEHHYGSTWKAENYLAIVLQYYRDSYIIALLLALFVISVLVVANIFKRRDVNGGK